MPLPQLHSFFNLLERPQFAGTHAQKTHPNRILRLRETTSRLRRSNFGCRRRFDLPLLSQRTLEEAFANLHRIDTCTIPVLFSHKILAHKHTHTPVFLFWLNLIVDSIFYLTTTNILSPIRQIFCYDHIAPSGHLEATNLIMY